MDLAFQEAVVYREKQPQKTTISMLENKPYIEISVKQSTKAVSQLGIFHFLILPPDCHLFEIFLEEELSFLKGGNIL